jgi:hypothetical protein
MKFLRVFSTNSFRFKALQLNNAQSSKPKSTNFAILHPSLSIGQVGEDAFFHRCDSIGVADGVGGWSDIQGIEL